MLAKINLTPIYLCYLHIGVSYGGIKCYWF